MLSELTIFKSKIFIFPLFYLQCINRVIYNIYKFMLSMRTYIHTCTITLKTSWWQDCVCLIHSYGLVTSIHSFVHWIIIPVNLFCIFSLTYLGTPFSKFLVHHDVNIQNVLVFNECEKHWLQNHEILFFACLMCNVNL